MPENPPRNPAFGGQASRARGRKPRLIPMQSFVRRSFELVILSRVFFICWAPGCGKQAEGERCDYAHSGEAADCESGLVCVPKAELVNGDTDRCCPANGTSTDNRCQPNAGIGGSGGTDAG